MEKMKSRMYGDEHNENTYIDEETPMKTHITKTNEYDD